MRSLFLSFALAVGLSTATSAQDVHLARRPSPDVSDVAALPTAERAWKHTGAMPAEEGQAVGAITGRVTDAMTGQPISAAQIYIEALELGVLSGENGRYLLLNVPTGTHALTATLIGYETVTVEVTVTSGQTGVQDFRMSQQAVAMDEIVVTGVPGGTRRRAVGNSVGTTDASQIAAVAPVATVQDVLRGRAPGVNMMGGGLVSQAPRIRIRGASSFSLSGNPLIYVDGVRANNIETTGYMYGNNSGVRGILSTLDPEQIEKIEVLKGPAAATLYGTEASRGVINIITKRGQAGGAKMDVMVRQGVNFIADPANRVAYENYWTDPQGEVQSINMVRYMEEAGRESVYSNGPVQEYSATLSGGSPDTRYFFAGAYQTEEGPIAWNWSKKLNLRTNLDSEITENLGITVSLGYTNLRDRVPSDGYASVTEGIQFGSARYLPDYYCASTKNRHGCDYLDGFRNVDVPARERSLENNSFQDRFNGSLTFTHRAFGWLTTRLTTGVDYSGIVNVAFREFQTNDTTIVSLGSNASKGFRNESRLKYFLTTTDLSSTADLEITPKLTASTSVGVQYYTRNYSYLRAGGQQFAGPGLSTVTATAIQDVPENNEIADRTLGSYVQETLAWQDRLFLTGAVRVDNNSAFGDDIKFITYPKASISWVLYDEPWFQELAPSWMSSLRLRAAWGQSGEQPSSFSALRTWSPVTGPNNSAGVTPTTVGNPDLTAEIGEETEVGFDTDLFDSRFGLQFTYYHKVTKDAILSRDLPPSIGFTGNQYVNAGKIVNEGLEAQFDATVLQTPRFRWDLGFNFSYNDAEILQLSGAPGDTTIIFNSWSSMEHRVGYAPASWFGVDIVSAELDPATHKAVNAMCSDGMGGTTACFDDKGNTIAPRVYLGRAIAPYEMSLSTNLAIGEGLRFYALFTSEQGHKRFDNTLRQRCRLYNLCRENAYPEEWDPIMRATVQSSDQIIDSWVNDVSFVRLKEVSVSYDLPQRIVEGFGLSHATWQLAARNLLTFTDWTDTDPEVAYTSGSRRYMAQNNLPLPQQIVSTIRLSF